jgi:hypothetical protein
MILAGRSDGVQLEVGMAYNEKLWAGAQALGFVVAGVAGELAWKRGIVRFTKDAQPHVIPSGYSFTDWLKL